MYPPTVGETARIMECVAILSPSEVPVAVSGTFLVMAELAIVLSSAPDITIGIMITHKRGMVLALLYKCVCVCVCERERGEEGGD